MRYTKHTTDSLIKIFETRVQELTIAILDEKKHQSHKTLFRRVLQVNLTLLESLDPKHPIIKSTRERIRLEEVRINPIYRSYV